MSEKMTSQTSKFEPFFWGASEDGEAFYSTHCLDTKPVLRAILPELIKIVDEIPFNPQDGRPFVIAEYGCRDGGLTMEVFQKLVHHVREKYKPQPDVNIIYEDQPNCDFKSLFLLANGLIGTNPGTIWTKQRGVYFSAIGRNFYEQCLPSNSVHIGVSTNAVHYLSARPRHIPEAIHFTFCDDATLQALYAAQAAKDWETFLLQRCRELAPGGVLFIVALANSGDIKLPGMTKRGKNFWLVLHDMWGCLYKEGRISKKEWEEPTYNTYHYTRDEFEEPFRREDSAVHRAGLRLIVLEIKWTPCVIFDEFVKRGAEDPQNVAAFAKKFARLIRTFGGGDFMEALRTRPERERNEIVDELFRRMEEEVMTTPMQFNDDMTNAFIVVRKI